LFISPDHTNTQGPTPKVTPNIRGSLKTRTTPHGSDERLGIKFLGKIEGVGCRTPTMMVSTQVCEELLEELRVCKFFRIVLGIFLFLWVWGLDLKLSHDTFGAKAIPVNKSPVSTF